MKAVSLVVAAVAVALAVVAAASDKARHSGGVRRHHRGGRGTDSGINPFPWSSGVELGNRNSHVKIEAYLTFTCPDCKHKWLTVIAPLLAKYRHRVSFVHHPFALPYQDYAYDATNAAMCVYRLSGNSTDAWVNYTEQLFANQDVFWNAYSLSQKQVWENYFGAWANKIGIDTETLISAMNGTITSGNDDAWYAAMFARQRTIPEAPTLVLNGWITYIDVYPNTNIGNWNLTQWESWLETAL